MKKLFSLCMACLLISGISFAQTRHHNTKKKKSVTAVKTETAPDSVKTAFQQKVMLADSAHVNWHKTPNGSWTATYLVNGDTTSAEFNSGGDWIATRTHYSSADLPANISTAIKNKYTNATIGDGWKIERSDVAAFYKVAVNDGGTEKFLYLNDAGTITE